MKPVALWFLCVLIAPGLVLAKGESVEVQIKAAFLYKFCNYIEWPENTFEQADSPLIIAVIGDEKLSLEVEQVIAGRKIGEHNLQLRVLSSEAEMSGVHVLYIGKGVGDAHGRWFHAANQHAVLTVTEVEESDQQGIINFVVVDNRVRFDVSQSLAVRSGLKLSSRLLSVARNVHSEGRL